MAAAKDLDAAIGGFIRSHGGWTYLLVFAVGITQTGFLLGPALPGTTILFICGVAARTQPGTINPALLIGAATIGAWAGSFIHYALGKWAGHRLFVKEKGLFARDRLAKAEEFFTRHGRLAMIIAPNTPIMRTFVPIAAGGAHMRLPEFALSSLAGVVVWVCGATLAGYIFGNVPGAKSLILGAAFLVSVVIIGRMIWQAVSESKKRASEPESAAV